MKKPKYRYYVAISGWEKTRDCKLYKKSGNTLFGLFSDDLKWRSIMYYSDENMSAIGLKEITKAEAVLLL